MTFSMEQNNRHTLPANTCLNEKYVIENILGKGGFGITYGGYHKESGVHVAIKEYFPRHIALRCQENDSSEVLPYPKTNTDEFEDGRRRFLEEARILKELKHLDSIVSVYDFFEENGTVYIVMEYIEGRTLRHFIDENGPITFSELLVLFTPLILSLSEIHANGLIHRDISPDNLILDTDSRLHLIDFGAAKQNATESEANTVILKAGYAPVESYIPNGKIGTWTDVYSLCATMYFSLTGMPPQEAIHRLDDETDTIKLSGLETLLPQQRSAIEQGLQIRPANRLDNMQKLYLALTAPSSPDNAETVRGSALSAKTLRRIRILQKGKKKTQRVLATVLVTLVVLSLFLFFAIYSKSGNSPDNPPGPPVTTEPSTKTESPTASAPDTNLNGTLLSMISVTDMKLKKASSLLKKLDASINVEPYYVDDDAVASGYVIHQSVAKDTVFTKGSLSSILLTVSKGAKGNTSSPKKNTASGRTTPPASATRIPANSPDTKSQHGKSDYHVSPEDEYTDFTLE